MGKKGNPYVKHYVPFLKAEQVALASSWNEASEHYQKAISLASENGHLLHAALSSERYSEFLSELLNEQQEESCRLKESIQLYKNGELSTKQERHDDLDSA